MPADSSQVGGPDGHSYGAVILPTRDATRTDLLQELGGIRFTGWIAPPEQDWLVVLGDPGDGVVADERRGIIEVGALLAEQLRGPVLAVRVRHDRQLALVAWRAAEEVARYCSDPSREPDADREVLSEPVGAEYAGAFAQLWNRPDAAEPLSELLEEELDPDSVYESERLGRTAAAARSARVDRRLRVAASCDAARPRGVGVDAAARRAHGGRRALARRAASSGPQTADSTAGHRRAAHGRRDGSGALDVLTERTRSRLIRPGCPPSRARAPRTSRTTRRPEG